MKGIFTAHKIITWISFALLLGVWEILSHFDGMALILPGPVDTLMALGKIVTEPGFLGSLGSTLWRGVLGFVLALIFGGLVGILGGLYPMFDAAFRPLLVTIRSTPVIAIILLALIWLKVEQVPVFIGFLTMFPILSRNLSEGIRNTDPGLIEMARVFRVSPFQRLIGIQLPSVTPFLMSGISTAIGFGWRAIIIGEVLSQPRYGIGAMMQDAQSFLLVSELIAWTLLAVIIGFIFESWVVIIEKRIIHWKA